MGRGGCDGCDGVMDGAFVFARWHAGNRDVGMDAYESMKMEREGGKGRKKGERGVKEGFMWVVCGCESSGLVC